METVAIIIPARYASTRLPGKPLIDILGKPMIQHVYEQAKKVPNVQVVVATDNQRIFKTVESFDGKVVMTSHKHESGTDRLVEVATYLDADIYINLQGDEPLIDPDNIATLIDGMRNSPDIDVATLSHKINKKDAQNPNTVKVVTSHNGRACYFSRSAIPYSLKEQSHSNYQQHVGIYGYRKDILARYQTLPASVLEKTESLEQLRLLDNDISIHVFEVSSIGPGVDTPEDLIKVTSIMKGEPYDTIQSPLTNIKLVITDIDGVLTDGGLFYTENGETLKRFHARDGLGLKLLQQAGIQIAVLSGRDSGPLRKRINDLGITLFELGAKDKKAACTNLMRSAEVDANNTLFIGDDTIDLPAFETCGIAVSVGDAPSYVKIKADIVLEKAGGQGAFRELSDKILFAQGKEKLITDPNEFLKIHKKLDQ